MPNFFFGRRPAANSAANGPSTDSSWFMSVTATGDHTGQQYPSIGRTYVVKALHKILPSLHKKQRQICIDLRCPRETIEFIWSRKVRWLSMSTPKSRTLWTVCSFTSDTHSGVTAIPGAPAPPEGPPCWGPPPGARKKIFVYFSFSYQKDKNI